MPTIEHKGMQVIAYVVLDEEIPRDLMSSVTDRITGLPYAERSTARTYRLKAETPISSYKARLLAEAFIMEANETVARAKDELQAALLQRTVPYRNNHKDRFRHPTPQQLHLH